MMTVHSISNRLGLLTAVTLFGVVVVPGCGSVPAMRADAQTNQFRNLLPVAENGNLEAQDDIGYLYQTGEGTPADERQAVIWYRRAADQAYAPSERHLGYMYWAGLGISRDYAQALIWYRRAAQQGDAWAENNIGSLYFSGEGVPRDYPLALVWFTRAASQRNPAAEVNLGDLYLYGLGTPRDYTSARQWYTLAAVHGDFTAQLRLASLYVHGWGVTRDPGQAQYWFERAANHRFASADDFSAALNTVIFAHITYPPGAIKQGITGVTMVSFTYLDGKAGQVQIEHSSGSAVLDAAALQAVHASLFPMPPPGLPENQQFTVPVKFMPGP